MASEDGEARRKSLGGEHGNGAASVPSRHTGIPGTRGSATVLRSMEPSFSPSKPPTSPTLPTLVPLPRPVRGGCTRVRLGSAEVILEAVRGGHSLLWTNGREARRYAIGLHRDGQLTLQLR